VNKAETSIWRRPLGRRFWAWSLTVCALLLLLGTAFPYLYGAMVWWEHPTVAYRGVVIKVPCCWIYDRNGTPLTINRPSWALAGNGSSFSIDRRNIADADTTKAIALWKRFRMISDVPHTSGLTVDHPPEFNDARLICAQSMDTAHNMYEMHCMSTNAQWTFYLLGTRADAGRVYPVIEYVLSHATQFP